MCVGKIRLDEIGITHIGRTEIGFAEILLVEIPTAEVVGGQLDAREVFSLIAGRGLQLNLCKTPRCNVPQKCSANLGIVEDRTSQRGAFKTCICEIRMAEVGIGQIGGTKICIR